MTFESSASQAQIDARQHAFDNQPDPATLVSREEIRAALLDRHTATTQDKLDAAHVAICGCGGLGSTIAVALTRIGVGHLHLIDFDRVDMTNLNRKRFGHGRIPQLQPGEHASRFEELLLLWRWRDGSGTGCRPDGAARGRGRLPRSEHDHATDPRRGRRLTHCYVTPLP